MSLSLNITVSLQVGQSLTGLMNTAGPSCSTDCTHIEPLWGNFISPASAAALSTDPKPGIPLTPGGAGLLIPGDSGGRSGDLMLTSISI